MLPAIDDFRPQLLLISAGFDAHLRDPQADLMLETDDFAWITRELHALARRHAAGRVVSMLEGGYDLQALAERSVAHVRALLLPLPAASPDEPEPAGSGVLHCPYARDGASYRPFSPESEPRAPSPPPASPASEHRHLPAGNGR